MMITDLTHEFNCFFKMYTSSVSRGDLIKKRLKIIRQKFDLFSED